MTTIYDTDRAQIKALLVGQSVTKASDYVLILSNGTELAILPNTGCGGCDAGNYWVDELNECPNVITSVEFEDSGEEYDETLRVFVYAENQKINLLSVSGSVGNGFYGSGYRIDITLAATTGTGA